MASKGDANARKTALRIVGILGILVLLCCTGSAWFTYRVADDIGTGINDLDAEIGLAYPEGTFWSIEQAMAADASEASVLVVGFPELPPTEEHEAIVDRVWEMYCRSFATGGLSLDEIAVGRARPGQSEEPDGPVRHAGEVIEWDRNRHSTSDAAERTGISAPPDAQLLEWLGDTARVNMEKGDQE